MTRACSPSPSRVDKDPGRLVNVPSTLERLGLQAETGDAGDPGTFWDGRPFDRMLLDTPCSGTGAIRRHPDIKVLRTKSPGCPPATSTSQFTTASERPKAFLPTAPRGARP